MPAGAKLIAYGFALAAIVGAITWGVHALKQSGRDEANTACLVRSVNDAAAARNEVERVRNEVEAEAKSREQERQRKYDEDQQRRDAEQSQRDQKLRDLLSLQKTATPDCKQWRSELYRCATQ